ncbi:MAG: SDR family oxidoreductase [Dehalococcoidales bacterium]|nr:SDR family oxidoreductase [Dehalococcoidales bacterium]
MELGLQGKTAIVTGTGSQIGFGKGIAVYLAKEGCDVVCADIDLEGAQNSAGAVRQTGRRSIAVKVDITQKPETEAAIKQALAEFGKVDILVNCAGRASGLKPFVSSTPEDWAIDIDINFRGTMNFMHAVLPHMLERGYGKIVNFSTHAANQSTGLAGAGPYCAAKSGVVMLSRTVSGEVYPSGININIIAPGPGATNFHRVSAPGSDMEKLVQDLAKAGKTVLPDDIAYTVAFLVSDVSKKLSGQVLEVSGPLGRSAGSGK